MLNKRNTNLQNGCSTSREQISPTAKPPITSPSVWCWRMIRAVVEVAAPGMTKEDFNIHISENNELVISMEKKNEIKEDDHHNRRYLRREFSYSKFEQALILPEDVVKEKISANASNGVLTIDLPKRTPEEKAKVNRVIEIH